MSSPPSKPPAGGRTSTPISSSARNPDETASSSELSSPPSIIKTPAPVAARAALAAETPSRAASRTQVNPSQSSFEQAELSLGRIPSGNMYNLATASSYMSYLPTIPKLGPSSNLPFELHTSWHLITVHTNKCDHCHANKIALQRCGRCNTQFCRKCLPTAGERSPQHTIDAEAFAKLDWGPGPSTPRKPKPHQVKIKTLDLIHSRPRKRPNLMTTMMKIGDRILDISTTQARASERLVSTDSAHTNLPMIHLSIVKLSKGNHGIVHHVVARDKRRSTAAQLP